MKTSAFYNICAAVLVAFIFISFGLIGTSSAASAARTITFVGLSKPVQKPADKALFIKKELDRLFDQLAKARDEKQGRAIENQIWQTWMIQPVAEVQTLIADAMKARRWYDFAKAKKLLDKAVKLAPDYAEGYNQRGFILFLQEKYDESLSDIEKALALEPRHFGALAGQALILMRQGRFATAQTVLKKAVKIHPFLKERSMIVKPPEKDI